MRCDEVAHLLAASPDGVHLDDDVARGHVERCLRCQAEMVQYRKLLRALRTLRSEVRAPTPGLVAEVLASLEEVAERQAERGVRNGRAVAYVGGIAVATAAAGAGAIVFAALGRGRRMGIAG